MYLFIYCKDILSSSVPALNTELQLDRDKTSSLINCFPGCSHTYEIHSNVSAVICNCKAMLRSVVLQMTEFIQRRRENQLCLQNNVLTPDSLLASSSV